VDSKHEILVPVLPTDEPFGPPVEMEALHQPSEPRPPILVPPISPVVPSTPPFHSSPSLILTDWTPTPPRQLRTRSGNVEDATRAPDETTERVVPGKGSVDLEAISTTSEGSSSPFIEEGNATLSFVTRIEHSSVSNGVSLQANKPENHVLVPSSSQARSGRQRPQGAGSLTRLQLSPRRTQKHRGELRTEFNTSLIVPMHPTKRGPSLKPFPPSTEVLVPASVETSQESCSIRIPPGHMADRQESQESRSIPRSTAPESSIKALLNGSSWEMTARDSIRIPPSGQIAITRESQETSLTSQNPGEAGASFETPEPLTSRDHRWKSKNINAMLSSSPIYTTPPTPNSPVAETSVGPMDSMSSSSDGDIACRQYIEDNLRVKEREGSPTSCAEEMSSQLGTDKLDNVSSKPPSADESGESDEEPDTKKEGPSIQFGIVADEKEHTQQHSGDVEVDERHRPSQGVLEGQVARLTPPPTLSEKPVEVSVQPVEREGEETQEPQESDHIEPPDTKEDDNQNQTHAQLARTPTPALQPHFLCELRAQQVEAGQREAEPAQAGAHEETETDDTTEVEREAGNRRREGVKRALAPDAPETRLAVESAVLRETAREELQDIGLQQKLLRPDSHPSPMRAVPLHQPEPQVSKARVSRRLPWLPAEPDGCSFSVFNSPHPPKQGQVLGKRKRILMVDDIQEQARIPPSSSALKVFVKKPNMPEALLQRPVQLQGVIKRRKVEFVDVPLRVEFEDSESDSDEIPVDSLRSERMQGEVDPAAPVIRVQDGSPFSRNKPPRPPSFDVPSPLPSVDLQGPPIPDGRKVQPSRLTHHVHQSALSVIPSTSVKDEQPMALPVYHPRRVSAQSSTVQRRRIPVSSRAYTRYQSPVSSLFREDRSFNYRPSAAPRRSLSYIDQSEFSEPGDGLSIISTDTLPHVDFLKKKAHSQRGSSSTRSLRR
jgi:hypothetical protein